MIYISKNFQFFGYKKKIKTNSLYCRLVKKSNQKNKKVGQFPRINWKPNLKSGAIKPEKIKHEIKKILQAPHYKFVIGNKNDYINYMNKAGWAAGYGLEHSQENFKKIIKIASMNKNLKYPFKNLIKVKKLKNKFVIEDGLHRISAYIALSKATEVDVIILKENFLFNFLISLLRKIRGRIKYCFLILKNIEYYYFYILTKIEERYLKLNNNKNTFMIVIWPNSIKNKKKIFKNINKNFKKAKLFTLKNINIKKFINQIYVYDTAPKYHILNKSLFLIEKYNKKKLSIIFFKIDSPKFRFIGEGKYRHKTCIQIRKFKNDLRQKFNKNKFYKGTEIHSIHASDIPSEAMYIKRKYNIEYV